MSIDPQAAWHATSALPDIPRDQDGPVFHEPWEAQAFAMALALHARGLFTWTEWAQMLGKEIKRGSRPWRNSSPRKALQRPKPCTATAMPGTAPPTARHMVRRSN